MAGMNPLPPVKNMWYLRRRNRRIGAKKKATTGQDVYVAENGTTIYVAEDGTTIYTPET